MHEPTTLDNIQRIVDALKNQKVESVKLDAEKGESEIQFAGECDSLIVQAILQDGLPRLNVHLYVPSHNFGITVDGNK